MFLSRFAFSSVVMLAVCILVSCQSRQETLVLGQEVESVNAESASGSDAEWIGDNKDWPRLLGENFDGVAKVDTLSFDWTDRPTVAWRLPVGTGYGLGSVVDGSYFHADAVSDESTYRERLRRFDMKTGKQIYSVDRAFEYQDLYGYEPGPRGTPTSDGKMILTVGCDGVLTCRDIVDGSLKWSVDTNQRYGVVQNFFGVGASPLIVDDKVIVQVGGSPAEDQQVAPGALNRVSANGSLLIAFDLETGQEAWKCGDDLASYSSPRTIRLTAPDQTVQELVLMFARDHLWAIDPKEGSARWKFAHRASILESVNAMIPVVQGNRVFLSECYQIGSVLLEVSEDDAKVLWQDPPFNRRAQSMRCHWSTPILVDGYLYGCSGRNNPDSDFRCIEFSTGKVMWVDDRRTRSSVVKVGDHLAVLEEDGMMRILRPNPKELDLVAEYDLGDQIYQPCWAAPIVVGNRMLIRGDRHVLCLTLNVERKK